MLRSNPKYALDGGATLLIEEGSRAAMVMEILAAARRMAERKVKNCFTMMSGDRMPERLGVRQPSRSVWPASLFRVRRQVMRMVSARDILWVPRRRCGCGEIGIRGGLKIHWGFPRCRFESDQPHHFLTLFFNIFENRC